MTSYVLEHEKRTGFNIDRKKSQQLHWPIVQVLFSNKIEQKKKTIYHFYELQNEAMILCEPRNFFFRPKNLRFIT